MKENWRVVLCLCLVWLGFLEHEVCRNVWRVVRVADVIVGVRVMEVGRHIQELGRVYESELVIYSSFVLEKSKWYFALERARTCLFVSAKSRWIYSFFDRKAEWCLPSSLLSQSIKCTVSYLKFASLSRTKKFKSESMERLLQKRSYKTMWKKKMSLEFTPSHNQTTLTATKQNKQNSNSN